MCKFPGGQTTVLHVAFHRSADNFHTLWTSMRVDVYRQVFVSFLTTFSDGCLGSNNDEGRIEV